MSGSDGLLPDIGISSYHKMWEFLFQKYVAHETLLGGPLMCSS